MEEIYNIIDKKAAYDLAKCSIRRRKVYRDMLYAGVQVTLNGRTLDEVASEIGYSKDYTSHLVQNWRRMVEAGDVTANLIIAAVNRLPKYKRFRLDNGYSRREKTERSPVTHSVLDKFKTINVLGFRITPEDNRRARAAVRDAILFFDKFGKGSKDASGAVASVTDGTKTKWLPLETAAIYCGCTVDEVKRAGESEIIECRIYRRSRSHCYYEYKLEDLDKFIQEHNLI